MPLIATQKAVGRSIDLALVPELKAVLAMQRQEDQQPKES